MRLYRKADGTVVGTQAEAGKGYAQIEVPVDKAGLIDWINENARPTGIMDTSFLGINAAGEHNYPEHEPKADPIGGSAPPSATSSYTSPLDARTVIAGIDAGMVSSAVRQFDGVNLAKVMTAGIERMSELARQLDTVDLLAKRTDRKLRDWLSDRLPDEVGERELAQAIVCDILSEIGLTPAPD